MGKLVSVSLLVNMTSAFVSLLLVTSIILSAGADQCTSVRDQACLKRTEVKGAEWMQKFDGGDYCFKMFGSSVCLVDEWKPRLVVQCKCQDPECGCMEATAPPTEPATTTISAPEPTEASIGMCSCSRGFSGNYINWASCGEGYSPDTWWSLFKHCWCRCCSEGEDEGVCGDWSS